MSVDTEERVARAGLSRVAEPADDLVAPMLAEAGAAAGLWAAIRRGDPTLPARMLGRTHGRARTAQPERDLAHVAAMGGRLVCPGDAEWPPALDDLATARPYALWVRGPLRLDEACQRSVSVVGARAATTYGVTVAGELGVGLAARGCTVVSGGAYGIDGAAHRGALAGEGLTVAVLASGIDTAYPPGHESLLARVAEVGLVVSEWPPGCSPMRHRFLTRNRVIAAITPGTVVVEAAVRSGALATARQAYRLGRAVMAVPGPVTSPMSGGCHLMLRREGVICVSDAAEVVEAVGRIGDDLAPVPSGPALERDELSAEGRRVLDAVPAHRPSPPARIATTSGLSVSEVLALLQRLAVAGFVTEEAGRYRLPRKAEDDDSQPDRW